MARKGNAHLSADSWARAHFTLPNQNTPLTLEQLNSPKTKTSRGPRSLVDLCIRVAAESLSYANIGDLDDLPAPLVLRIWRRVERTQFPSLQSWLVCLKRLANDYAVKEMPLSLLKHTAEVPHPAGSLAAYIRPLTASAFDFIVHLTITDRACFNTHDLLSISQLKNLGVLEIIQPADEVWALTFPRVSDSIIREWSRQPDPLPLLRVLRIWGEDFTTTKSLRYLSVFPSLVFYDVAGLRRDWRMKDRPDTFGWEFEKRTWNDTSILTLLQHQDLLERHNHQTKKGHLFEFLQDGVPCLGYECESSDLQYCPPSSPDCWPAHSHSASFDIWGFLLFSMLGQEMSDFRTFLPRTRWAPATQAVLISPSRPFVSLRLGKDSHWHTGLLGLLTPPVSCSDQGQLIMVKANLDRAIDSNEASSELHPDAERVKTIHCCSRWRDNMAFDAQYTFIRTAAVDENGNKQPTTEAADRDDSSKRRPSTQLERRVKRHMDTTTLLESFK
ncbi:hypothetical protein F4780DRAFT_477352 [Xylariomycetidae sp. FL0641]|nr:hypothetical protein F4780DRAFT_477352 [Xylariomycetidae sp. FL0641]